MKISTEKHEWKFDGKNFSVVVVRWERASYKQMKSTLPEELSCTIPEYHWNIYAYIYKDHPIFEKIISESTCYCGFDIPLHGGVTYNSWYYNSKGDVVYKQIGCDYQHLYDERFGSYSTKEEAYEIFNGADELIQFLTMEN